MDWSAFWAQLPEECKDTYRAVGLRYRGMSGIGEDGSVPDAAAAEALYALQELENEVLTAHADWLARTKRKFEANGRAWTTEELGRRSRLWEHE